MWHEWGRSAYTVLVGIECNTTPERPSRKFKCNIKMYRKVTGWEGLDWIHLAHEKHK